MRTPTKITAIILDWAGTCVDYGCFAPTRAFVAAFSHFGITPTLEEIRAPMGIQKRDHIQEMLNGKRLSALWQEVHGKAHTQLDIDAVYGQFEPSLLALLPSHAGLLPGVLAAVSRIREMGIVIGSSTGYNRAMMDVVAAAAEDQGYAPDCLVCPEEVAAGRPAPYMIWHNLEKLGVLSIAEVLKIGDTAADMQEGKNAGCFCVGIIEGSSTLGLSEAELAAKSRDEAVALYNAAGQGLRAAGADYVLSNISALPVLVELLHQGVPVGTGRKEGVHHV
ncbi:MAG: phosphonoacetaldehyde hydrolase [Actinomycetia bacterium]|nr:phosphonoacetaldehyde hydrolase [Actinomycetes bacterium]